ncbi:hypothetical protein PIB30_065526 [Stylosanthes scabra]|uniref:Uncharacterized protein n=1 Tax=Stylosanthes scabra TaxID=79078 RepID=A0ABU6QMR5_9FABA|nr:hypothetical protein [Stylosanthes scabra]
MPSHLSQGINNPYSVAARLSYSPSCRMLPRERIRVVDHVSNTRWSSRVNSYPLESTLKSRLRKRVYKEGRESILSWKNQFYSHLLLFLRLC